MASACATAPTERPPQPPSSPTVQAELGYREVVQAGEEYARLQGYALAGKPEAVELRPNYWRLRFGLAEGHSGKLLDLEFDGASRAVVHEEIIPTPASEPVPSHTP
jgi:hypothetical protein